MCDRSQRGNKSCIRNERYSGGVFVWTPDYVLPNDGLLEFDFMLLTDEKPKPEDEIDGNEMAILISWFQ